VSSFLAALGAEQPADAAHLDPHPRVNAILGARHSTSRSRGAPGPTATGAPLHNQKVSHTPWRSCWAATVDMFSVSRLTRSRVGVMIETSMPRPSALRSPSQRRSTRSARSARIAVAVASRSTRFHETRSDTSGRMARFPRRTSVLGLGCNFPNTACYVAPTWYSPRVLTNPLTNGRHTGTIPTDRRRVKA